MFGPGVRDVSGRLWEHCEHVRDIFSVQKSALGPPYVKILDPKMGAPPWRRCIIAEFGAEVKSAFFSKNPTLLKVEFRE